MKQLVTGPTWVMRVIFVTGVLDKDHDAPGISHARGQLVHTLNQNRQSRIAPIVA